MCRQGPREPMILQITLHLSFLFFIFIFIFILESSIYDFMLLSLSWEIDHSLTFCGPLDSLFI